MKIKISASLLLVFIMTLLFAVPILAYESIKESSTGYPYDENEKYNYYVADSGFPAMVESGNDRIFTFNITVRDKGNRILSTDEYVITMKNLPSQEYVTFYEKMSGNTRLESAGYKVAASLPYIYSSGDWESYSKNMIESLKNDTTKIKEGSFMGKKALIVEYNEIDSYFNRNRTRGESGSYFVYIDDIIIPNGIIVLKIAWNVTSFGYIGYSIPERVQEVETRVSEKYEIGKSDVQKILNQYNGIKFETKKIAQMRTFKDKKTPYTANQTKNTTAAATAGTVAVVVLSTIIASATVISAGGAVGGPGGTGESGNEGKGEKNSYKMVLYKEFGDKIRYNGETVFVYAKMVEIKPDGTEIDRLDLTQRIEIFSNDNFLEIPPATLSGEYMGAAVSATSNQASSMLAEGVISFCFKGVGGIFQNNVKFKMIGECFIELEGQNLYVNATSGGNFSMIYKLVDFVENATVEVLPMQNEIPFTLEIGVDNDNNAVIIATDTAESKPFSNFFDSFSCEIIAKNEKEYARTVFYVVMCYEGVLPDFLGKEKRIKGFKDENGNMEKTLIAFSQGIWSDAKKTLEISKPENLKIECTDEKGIFEVIGLSQELNDNFRSITDKVYYDFTAKLSFPSQNDIKGLMKISNTIGEKTFENETEISLVPDLIEYSKKWEEEYQNCIKIINTYLPEHFRDKKLEQLKRDLPKLGIEDLKAFRHGCWGIAERSIMQDKESYLIASYWYDEAIATAELLVFIGDIAFDVALAPFGGPIAGFLAAQVKSSVIDMVTLYVEKPSIGFNEIVTFIENRFIQMAGQVDGAFEMPKPDQTKKLAAWLACYTLYRVGYHWWFDKDDDQNPIGLTESVKRGLLDFAGKGAATILSGFVGDIAKKKGWDKYSIADADQAFVNEKMQKGVNIALDTGDKLAGKADDAVDYAVKILLEFIEKIKSGAISF